MARPGSDPSQDAAHTKWRWRKELVAERRRVPAAVRFSEALSLSKHLTSGRIVRPGQTVCAYVPIGSEPGSAQMLEDLTDFGARVLLPVVTGEGPLDWGWYAGKDSLRPGPYGLREPNGELLGSFALRIADLVLVPALAVDKNGVRLGRGAGHYDRTLSDTASGTHLVAVVRDQEIFESLPAEPHDVRMTAVLTPNRGLLRFV
ncbi:5-formyltetrahydrofolate cyclo-ligase [Actinophytocola sp.]|uniref:5-formyltetrahydrofolate cyclo-ligase n=1 Tax=Actinophytocola sp. TaxID=1872138 RepID=UPI002ED2F696